MWEPGPGALRGQSVGSSSVALGLMECGRQAAWLREEVRDARAGRPVRGDGEAEARPVSPLDQMMLFITPEDLVGYRMPVEDVARLISEVPLEHAVNWACSIVGAIYNPGRDRREVELEYFERYYSEDLKVQARNLLREPTRVLPIPQALMVFVRLAFAVCKPCNDPAMEAELRPMVLAIIRRFGLSAMVASSRSLSGLVDVSAVDSGGAPRSWAAILNALSPATFSPPVSWPLSFCRLAVFWASTPMRRLGGLFEGCSCCRCRPCAY
ncbi:hypothetical protein ABIE44_002727 [Marmoricola sp. OAE513]